MLGPLPPKAGVLGIYGLITAVIINGKMDAANYSAYSGYAHLGAGGALCGFAFCCFFFCLGFLGCGFFFLCSWVVFSWRWLSTYNEVFFKAIALVKGQNCPARGRLALRVVFFFWGGVLCLLGFFGGQDHLGRFPAIHCLMLFF